jgi:hypothetical protein
VPNDLREEDVIEACCIKNRFSSSSKATPHELCKTLWNLNVDFFINLWIEESYHHVHLLKLETVVCSNSNQRSHSLIGIAFLPGGKQQGSQVVFFSRQQISD